MSPNVPHWVGVIGEGFNFAGATVLAIDLLFRRRERLLRQSWVNMHAWALRNRITSAVYKGIPIVDPDFGEKVAARRATLLGIIGTALLALGFLLLAGYHLLEIYGVEPPVYEGTLIIIGPKFLLTGSSENRIITMKGIKPWSALSLRESSESFKRRCRLKFVTSTICEREIYWIGDLTKPAARFA
jgi:hypothetical protein